MSWFLENLEQVFEIAIAVATLIGGPSALYIRLLRKGVRELVEVIDDSRTSNKSFQARAEVMGRTEAVKALAKLG